MANEIEKFSQLIQPKLKNGQRFVSAKSDKLLASGENYGSVMLRIEILIQNENGGTEILHCVAKTPPAPGLTWYIFDTKLTFKIEMIFYNTVVPILNEFGRSKGVEDLINFVPKYINGRISKDPTSNVVDKDAVILLENLVAEGYTTGNRFVGFDKETSELLLRDLAILHASTIAFRRSRPQDFKDKILSHLIRKFQITLKEEHIEEISDFATKFIKLNENCQPHLHKIEEALRKLHSKDYQTRINELYATIVHHDYWVNNTLIKYRNGAPIQNKMVDFQVIDYHSLANDVTFFLYSSVELSVLQDHIDELYKLYYEKFIETLCKLQSNISEYNFAAFMEECGTIAKEVQFGHLIFLLIPILTLKGKARNLNEMQHCSIIPKGEDTIHENYHKRLQFILLDLVTRKWI